MKVQINGDFIFKIESMFFFYPFLAL